MSTKKKITRNVYKIYLNRNELYDIVTQLDKKHAEIIMKQADEQENNKLIGNEKEYFKRYYQQNKEAYKKRHRQYYLKNIEKFSEYNKAYREKKKYEKEKKESGKAIKKPEGYYCSICGKPIIKLYSNANKEQKTYTIAKNVRVN